MFGALRAAVVALLAVFVCAAPAQADELSGVWTGTYVCAQGVTGVRITIEHRGAQLSALFEFAATPENPGVPSGAFEMSGSYKSETGAVVLNAGAWTRRPDDYEVVHLRGRKREEGAVEVIEGRVLFDPWPASCTIFRVERRPAYISQSRAPPQRASIASAIAASAAIRAAAI